MARRIIFYEDCFIDFYKKQSKKVKDKNDG